MEPGDGEVCAVAGISSALQGQVTGLAQEPAIQRKKRHTHPVSNPLIGGVREPHDNEADPMEFILLGNQSKFAVNVPYKLPAAAVDKPKRKSAEVVSSKNDLAEELKAIKLHRVAPVTMFNPGKPSPKKRAKKASLVKVERHKSAPNPRRGSTERPGVTEKPTKRAEHANPATSESKTLNSNNNNNNNGVASKLSVDPLEYVMKHRAGLAPKRSHGGQRRSEYQKMFVFRKGRRPTPILAASEVIYNNNPQLAPSSSDKAPTPFCTEYRSQFRAWPQPAKVTPTVSSSSIENSNNANVNNNANSNDSKSNANSSDSKNNTNSNGNNDNDSNDNDSRSNSGNSVIDCGDNKVKMTVETGGKLHKKSGPVLKPTKPTIRVAGLPSKTVHEPITKQTAESPDSPTKSRHPPAGAWSSEYCSNFQPFTRFSYDQGAWRGAVSPHKKAQADLAAGETKSLVSKSVGEPPVTAETNWFAEVQELRAKAQEYRQRARGMHFSREHVGQLLTKQAKLWDDVSVSTTLSALSLDKAVGENSHLVEKEGNIRGVKREEQNQEPVDDNLSTASPHSPSSAIKRAGTHRLAWSCDGSRSTSESDSVRSIRSGHTEEPASTARDVPQNSTKTASYIPSVQPVTRPTSGKLLVNTASQCDCAEPSAPRGSMAAAVSPVAAGVPTVDTHDLIDEEAAGSDKDQILSTKYMHSPTGNRKSKAGLSTLVEGAADTYNVPVSKDPSQLPDNDDGDDQSHRSLLSSSMLSVASTTSSLASELLDRAEKRRAQFWGTRSKPSRK